MIQIEDAKIPVLICENEELDTTTPRGKNIFGKLVLDAELEAGNWTCMPNLSTTSSIMW